MLGLILSALALAAETSLRSLPRPRLQHLAENGDNRAAILERWIERSEYFFTATSVVGIVGTVLAAAMAILLTQAFSVLAGAVAVAIALLLVLTATRTLAHHSPEPTALAIALPFNIVATLLSPLTAVLSLASRLWHRLFRAREVGEAPMVTEDELRAWVDAGEEAGILEEEEREMIDSILEMEETTLHEIMVPRPDIVATPGDTPVSQAADLVIRYGYSRFPVYQDAIDNILGILYAKDLLRELREGRVDRPVKDLVRPAYFVPESKKANELLQELQRRKVHIALVVDEYGSIAGLVTIEDMLEEIVGEIQDEHDREEPKIQILGDGEAAFDATVSVDDVNETLGLHLQVENVDTIGGLVYERLGQIPVPGDTVTADGASITVLSTTGRRIRRVRVMVQRPDSAGAEGKPEANGGKPISGEGNGPSAPPNSTQR